MVSLALLGIYLGIYLFSLVLFNKYLFYFGGIFRYDFFIIQAHAMRLYSVFLWFFFLSSVNHIT